MSKTISLKQKILSFKKKWFWYTFFEFFCVVAPFLTICIFNHDKYFATKTSVVSCSAGFIIGFIVVLFTAVEKLPKLKAMGWYIVAVVLSWLFKTMISDFLLIISVSFAGYCLSLVFKTFSNKYKNLYKAYKAGIVNKEVATSIEELKINERGKLL